jgi:[protein-PII] uridylyltransferase
MKLSMQQVRSRLGDSVSPKEQEALFEAMPPNYLVETNPRAIARHVTLYGSLRQAAAKGLKNGFCLEAEAAPSSGTYEVTFLARDKAGLFSDVAGVMALNNINILSARIYTWRDGTAVDIFTVTPPLDPLHPEEIWKKIQEDLAQALEGRLPLSERLLQKAEPSLSSRGKPPSRRPRVNVDNESSDFFTLIEIFADDRIGLLYQITHTLFSLGIDIRIAKIATKGDQVADVFYVLDLEGQKLLGEEQIKRTRETLLQELN